MFKKNQDVSCSNCLNGYILRSNGNVACKVHGMLDDCRFKCGDFAYDPLKRVPSVKAFPDETFTENDFRID